MHNKIRFLRERRRWTQSDVAEALGVAVSTIRRWETGDTIPYDYHLSKLCDLFKTTPQDLGFRFEKEEEMSLPSHPTQEHPSTYFVQNRSDENELLRLKIQDHLITQKLGFISELSNKKPRKILDVGCGTGGWLIEIAKMYPDIQKLVGVDISKRMIEYAREQASVAKVDDRVGFLVMDALRMLEFPDKHFDFINQRFGTSYLRTWDWSKLLNEYIRVLEQNGTIRVAELEDIIETSSPAYLQWWNLFVGSFRTAGHVPENMTLSRFLTQHFQIQGLRNVEAKTVKIRYEPDTPATQDIIQDIRYVMKTAEPFLKKWSTITDLQYAELRKQVEEEFHHDFETTTFISIVTGQK